jgi:hypothetical protein
MREERAMVGTDDRTEATPEEAPDRPAALPVLEEAGRQLRAPWAASIAGLLFSVLFTTALVLVRSEKQHATRQQLGPTLLHPGQLRAAAAYELGIQRDHGAAASLGVVSADGSPERGTGGIPATKDGDRVGSWTG